MPYRGIRPPAHFVPEHRRGQDNLLGKFSLPFLWRCHHQIAQRPLLGCVSETPHLVIPVYEIHTVVQIAETVFLELDTQGESGIGVGDFLHTVAERLGQGLGVIQQADEAARVDVADIPVGTPLPPVWGFHGCDAAVHSIDFHHRTAREHLPSVLFDELLQNFREMQAASYETAGSLDVEHGYDCVDISRSLVSPAGIERVHICHHSPKTRIAYVFGYECVCRHKSLIGMNLHKTLARTQMEKIQIVGYGIHSRDIILKILPLVRKIFRK